MSKRRRGFPVRDAREARRPQRQGRREGAPRTARQRRSVPVRVRTTLQALLPQRRPLSTARAAPTTSGSAEALRGGKAPHLPPWLSGQSGGLSRVGGSRSCSRAADVTGRGPLVRRSARRRFDSSRRFFRHRGRAARRAPAKRAHGGSNPPGVSIRKGRMSGPFSFRPFAAPGSAAARRPESAPTARRRRRTAVPRAGFPDPSRRHRAGR